MRPEASPLHKLLTDVVRIATSKKEIKRLFRVPLYSSASYMAVANGVNSLLGFAFWIMVARFYSTEDVGLASAALAATGLLASLAHLGLGMGLIRFLPGSQNRSPMLNTAFTIGLITSVLAAVIFIAGLRLWSPALVFIREDPFYLAAFVLFTVAATLSIHVNEALLAQRRANLVLAKNLVFSLLKLALPLILVTFLHSLGIFASWGIATWVALLLSFFLFLPRSEAGYRPFFVIKREVVSHMFHFSFANYLSELFWGLAGSILPIMVLSQLGAEPNAYFYIAWTTAGVLSLLPTAISISLFAEGCYDEGRLAINIRRSLKMAFVLLVPAVILTLIIADKLLLMFGSAYSESGSLLLRIMAVSTLPLTVNLIYLGIKRVQKKLSLIIGMPALVAVLSVGLGYLLLPRWGIAAAGIAWLISQTVVALAIAAKWLREGGIR